MANIDMQDRNGRTLLHHAVINEQPATVAELLKNGANPDVIDKRGRSGFTPMWYACCVNHNPINVELLKRAKATITADMLNEITRQRAAEPLNRKFIEVQKALTTPVPK